MQIPIYHVDAFTSCVFGGNPAAVCPLEDSLSDATLQSIAAEHNLSETAFLWRKTREFTICGGSLRPLRSICAAMRRSPRRWSCLITWSEDSPRSPSIREVAD